MTRVNRRTRASGSEQLIGALVPPSLLDPRPVPASMVVLPARRLPTGPDAPVLDMARLDASGRLSARSLLAGLGWCSGYRVDIDVVNGLLMIVSAPAGRHMVGARGALALPAATRQLCGIAPWSPVVLAAYPRLGLVVVHPAGVVAQLLHDLHVDLSGGRHGG